MRAIRDAESRTRFLGYSVESFKLWTICVFSHRRRHRRALYVPQIGIINPSEFAPINSIEIVIWLPSEGGARSTAPLQRSAGELCENYLTRRVS